MFNLECAGTDALRLLGISLVTGSRVMAVPMVLAGVSLIGPDDGRGSKIEMEVVKRRGKQGDSR